MEKLTDPSIIPVDAGEAPPLVSHVLLATLRCSCGGSFGTAAGALRCSLCGRTVPVVNGIPRFVEDALDPAGQRTRDSFGYEWTHFNDWRPSGSTNFNEYFNGVDLGALHGRLVLDAGCGMGRHARQLAPFAGDVIAVDFSDSIHAAARNVRGIRNVHCVQADLLDLPLRDGMFDFVYSLGVLHHLAQTEEALAGLVRKVRSGGKLRVYLYWRRRGWAGGLLMIATAARRVTTRMAFPVLRACCWLLSVGLYGAVVLPYRVASKLGLRRHEQWPLFVYTKYPFAVLYNDQFDRFSAPIEKRYDRDEVRALLERAGLRDVTVQPAFGWIGEGTRPA